MTVTVAEADTILRSMLDPDRAERFVLTKLYGTVEGAQAAVALMAADLPDSVVWASMLVYLSGGADPEPLARFVADTRAPLRISAAVGLLARGDARGFEPLIAELEAGQSDPSAAWAQASLGLTRWTAIADFGPPLDATADQRAAGAQGWRAWWTRHASTVHFSAGLWEPA